MKSLEEALQDRIRCIREFVESPSFDTFLRTYRATVEHKSHPEYDVIRSAGLLHKQGFEYRPLWGAFEKVTGEVELPPLDLQPDEIKSAKLGLLFDNVRMILEPEGPQVMRFFPLERKRMGDRLGTILVKRGSGLCLVRWDTGEYAWVKESELSGVGP